MNLRTLSLLITVALIALLAAFNWNTLAAPSVVSLGVTEVQAPLGVLMLALTCLLGVFFVAYVLWLQGSVLMEARRHAKEMQAQRDLADKAEASRFTELRTVLEDLHARDKEVLMARLDALEAHLVQRAQESDNSTAAYLGQLEQQVRLHQQPGTGAADYR
ncbi:LapA family protein [Delftia lacustris]|uniref:LapA family protein n=1 Tax=Delftia lacustris TaxID=558537 RepID=UPI0035A7084F